MDAVYPVLQAAKDQDADALGAANDDADSLLEQYRNLATFGRRADHPRPIRVMRKTDAS